MGGYFYLHTYYLWYSSFFCGGPSFHLLSFPSSWRTSFTTSCSAGLSWQILHFSLYEKVFCFEEYFCYPPNSRLKVLFFLPPFKRCILPYGLHSFWWEVCVLTCVPLFSNAGFKVFSQHHRFWQLDYDVVSLYLWFKFEIFSAIIWIFFLLSCFFWVDMYVWPLFIVP